MDRIAGDPSTTATDFGDVDRITAVPDEDFAREWGLNVERDEQEQDQGAEEGAEAEAAEPAPEEEAAEASETKDEASSDDEAAEEKDAEEKDAEAKDDWKPITPFQVFDDEGELEIPRDLKITFKANGKVHERVPLDKVVRLAQSGFYNEELQKEVEEARQLVPRYEQELERTEAALEDHKALVLKLLEDDEFLAETRQQYEEARSPEARARRAEEALARREQQEQLSRFQAEAVQFASQVLDPTMENLLAQYPTVTREELFGKLAMAITPLQRNGVVPRQAWPQVANLLEGEIGQWMAQLHEARASERAAASQQADAKVKKAQEAATKAKRQFARAMKPSAGAGSGGARKVKPPQSAEEAAEQILSDIFG